MKPETHYAKSGDVYIAYQINGDGQFDMVLAPGTFSHLDMDWDVPMRADFYRKLGLICRLVRFDKRGTGLSDRPTQMATLEQRTDDIRAVMDAVGLESAVIFGVSEGASMACMFAATYPQRTRSLLTWGAMARWIATEDHPWGMDAEKNAEMIRDVQENWPSDWYIRGPGAGFGPDASQELVDQAKRYMRAAGSPSAVAAYETMNSEIDIRPILGTINVPALVMNRTGDPVADVEAARDMAKRIPGAKFIEYPGKTHSIMAIEPEKVVGAIQEFVTGVRSAVIDDRVLATVLFVDIADSTKRLSELGDRAWKDKLGAYYRLVRAELERYRGRETNTAGDGIMASFDGPARAIRCALTIASGVKPLGLEIRAGVHTGEVELMGDNIGGIALHIGSRIQGESAPGELLVSSTTKDLVAGSGLAFRPLGERELKGVPGKWRLYVASD
ncbi:MAG: adenylate/guanylate cyclase domain-containing protein [Candidatus Eremiobacteraeota bacterium]|nr:adenylate/guanylate cyclase domain-containing protein [Candidatus Eremiobacteraeota bacterium]